MNNQIIARVTRSGGGAWEEIPFADGAGTILRPHPNAGGTAHPRYMQQGEGFLSIPPSWGLLRLEDEILGDGIVVALEWRKTRRGEEFAAVLPAPRGAVPTHLLVLADWLPAEVVGEDVIKYVYHATDQTASGAKTKTETAFLVEIGAEIWDGPTPLTATRAGLKEGIGKSISMRDLEVLGTE